MTNMIVSEKQKVWVAIDVGKKQNDVLVQLANGNKKGFKIANQARAYREFMEYLASLNSCCEIGLEATANYHRNIAYYLQIAGFKVQLISALAAALTREALHNSWDKNDPKDAQVILHLLKAGIVQKYHDPLIHQYHDIQEMAKTYYQVSKRKVKVQHSIVNHYLTLYFPEAEKYLHSTRAKWFSSLLSQFPTPNSIIKYPFEEFANVAWDIAGRKVNKHKWLEDFYHTAQSSIGLPIAEDSPAITMFRMVLQEHQALCQRLMDIEKLAEHFFKDNRDYYYLKSIPGIGCIIALTILSEGGDLRRFNHYRQFLKFCGFDLCTHQSGLFRGKSKLSKYGNARLRYAFWIAATVALRMRENTFRRKFENYIKRDPLNPDLKRKAYTAVAAKMARVAYSVVKNQTNYRSYYESIIPSGRIASVRP